MNIASIYRLAQAKLSTESSRADHNLLLLVGHLNLLGAIHIHFDISEYEEMQRLDTELTALKAKADGRDAQSTPLCTANNRIAVFSSETAPVKLTYFHATIKELEVDDDEDDGDEDGENHEEEGERYDMLFQLQPQLIPSSFSLFVTSFPQQDRRSSLCIDPIFYPDLPNGGQATVQAEFQRPISPGQAQKH